MKRLNLVNKRKLELPPTTPSRARQVNSTPGSTQRSNPAELIAWIPMAKQKPQPPKGHKGIYLVTFSNGLVGFDGWFQNDFDRSAARDPKTGGRDYDEFVIAWAEPPTGYVEMERQS
jgi:hypothetical protein